MIDMAAFKMSLKDCRSNIESIFGLLEDAQVQNSLAKWAEMSSKPDLVQFLKSEGVSVPDNITSAPSSDTCFNLCIGSWCPLHVHLPPGAVHVGMCED